MTGRTRKPDPAPASIDWPACYHELKEQVRAEMAAVGRVDPVRVKRTAQEGLGIVTSPRHSWPHERGA